VTLPSYTVRRSRATTPPMIDGFTLRRERHRPAGELANPRSIAACDPP